MTRHTLSAAAFVQGPQGPRSLLQSVDYCTRCNACVQSCPSYLLNRQEAFSPRGRNQIVRLLLERKIKISSNPALLQDTTRTCLLCARCTTACAGALPVADHMVALRRAQGISLLPKTLMRLLRVRAAHPAAFDTLVTSALFLRRCGLLRLLRMCGLTLWPAWKWLKHADDILPRRAGTLTRLFKKHRIPLHPDQPEVLYLPSFEASFLTPQTALRVWQLLQPRRVYVLNGQSSGLFEYVYGQQRQALVQLKHLLTRWEKLSAGKNLPLLTDSIEVYSFLKHSPVLFAAWPGWKNRAEKLAAHTEFAAQLPFAKPAQTPRCALDCSSLLYPPAEAAVRARKIFKTLFGKNFVECEYSPYAIAAGGMAFVPHSRAEEMVLENVKDVARRQIKEVYCLSGLAALELDAALRRHYPQARARHIVYLQDE